MAEILQPKVGLNRHLWNLIVLKAHISRLFRELLKGGRLIAGVKKTVKL